VKIKTRAYASLWLILALAAAGTAFIFVVLDVAGRMDVERQRIAEVLSVHGRLWRTVIENKHDQESYAITRMSEVRQRVDARRMTIWRISTRSCECPNSVSGTRS
jgi:tRNA splicing ligase